MKCRVVSIAALCGLLLSGPASASGQDPADRPQPPQAPKAPAEPASGPRFLDTAKVLGTDVVMAQSPAAETPDKTEQQPKGAGAAKPIGKLHELVIDSRGTLTHAILMADAKCYAIPKARLAWSNLGSNWMLAVTDFDVTKEKACDPKRPLELDGGAADAAADRPESDAGAPRPLNPPHPGKAPAAATGRGPGTRHLATDLGKIEVRSRDASMGTGEGVLVEADSCCAAFLRIARGGVLGIGESEYLIPWQSLEILPPQRVGDSPRAHVDIDQARFDSAPKLGDGKNATVDDLAFRERVYAFYGVKAPGFDAAKPPRDDGGSHGAKGAGSRER